MRTLFLSSAGVRFPIIEKELLKILPKNTKQIKVCMITTAHKYEKNIDFALQDISKLKSMGFEVTQIDLTGKNETELENLLIDKDIIYVEGGNTFVLLDEVNKSGFAKVLDKLLDKGIIYLGVSAGSYIACPTIDMCDSKENIPGLKNLTALNLVPFLMSVHYNRPKYKKIRDGVLNSKYPVKILSDDQALLIQDDKVKLVGEGEEIKII